MKIHQLTPASPEWALFTAHLKAVNDAEWVLDEDDLPKQENLFFFAAIVDRNVVGSISVIRQEITIPETEWAADRDRTLRDPEGNPYYEILVHTFRVEKAHRRKGYGRALQEAALNLARETGCIQMRSWSSLDKQANYALKLSLGFGFHPEVQQTASGLRVSGGYFVKRV
ncbi:MAG: GNAT family N-acetyltransferase [Anaerolineales bacterium]